MPSIINHVLNTHRYPYFIRRNSRGSLPVYSDIRNGRTRYLVSIRNVQGRVNSLAQDLKQSLFDPSSLQAQRLSVKVQHQRHIVLSGGRFKRDVMAWLTAKGF
ncbi:ribosomal protein L49/IMG2 [Boletus edulis]|uniref:Large ribosomal subunit protein mL49 n=1 Tax=Boletus edulis BED1 TaxID=1328754 RepID=A0AAD4BPR9_BOLED|nr:ribosomal protein L49/IMG2 [Boletus edulis]KAF8436957.1 ribosomal protein L49/IMG2 [Boletus edulis BED1]